MFRRAFYFFPIEQLEGIRGVSLGTVELKIIKSQFPGR